MDLPAGFVSDGCTGFFDWWRGIYIRPCCEVHDLSWWKHPGDWGIWLSSNVDLSACLWGLGVYEIAALGFLAVSTLGAILFALPPKGREFIKRAFSKSSRTPD